eukprot:scaffold33603_cov75-Phaeocystis_antarctica.AAC.1
MPQIARATEAKSAPTHSLKNIIRRPGAKRPPQGPPRRAPTPAYATPAPGLRHNMTAPFAPHAVPAALACTCIRACPCA